MRRASVISGVAAVLLVSVAACNAIVDATGDVPGSMDSSIPVVEPPPSPVPGRDGGAAPAPSSAPEAGPAPEAGAAPIAEAGPGSIPEVDAGPCGHSCLGGTCDVDSGLCLPEQLGTGFVRTTAVVADPGTIGSVFFASYDNGAVYRVDKATGAIAPSYPVTNDGTPTAVGIVTTASTVYWTSALNGDLAWATRNGATSATVLPTSYGVSWSGPWWMGSDAQYLYWCDRWGYDCWRMDFGLTTPQRIFTEKLPDGGAGSEQLWGGMAVEPGPNGYFFVAALNQLSRMNKDGTGVVAFAHVSGQSVVGLDGGYVYWVNATGALLRAPEASPPPCDTAPCAQTVVAAGKANIPGAQAFDKDYVYWADGSLSAVSRARKDGSSEPQPLAFHRSISGLAVDDVAVYYAVQWEDQDAGVPTGSLYRVAK
ncbi:MAG TPA: hypothetical protein VGI39_45890 [Polyangiaceae bacterium]|jgi:hypothetical protein